MRTLMRAGVLIFFSLGILFLNFWRDSRKTVDAFQWTPVAKKNITRVVSCQGMLLSARTEVIASKVQENVVRKLVKEGEAVVAGQLLAELSQTNTKPEYDRKKNAFDDAKAELAKARREVGIQRELFRQQAVPRTSVENAESLLRRQSTALKTAEQDFILAQEKMDSAQVKASTAGVILRDAIGSKQQVYVGDPLFIIGDGEHFMARVQVDELEIQSVREGQSAAITVDAYPGKVIAGKVKSIATQAERGTFAQVEVQLEVVDAAGVPLKHNLTARAEIQTEGISDAWVIPVTAVNKDEKGTWVRVRDAKDSIRRQDVRLGIRSHSEVQVLDGGLDGLWVGTLTDKGS